MKSDLITSYLDELYPNPKCELNYSKDYELLIAVMLSAQTTDKRVNSVTSILFSKYDSLEKLRNADVDDISNIIRPIGTFNKKAIFVKEIANYLVDNCDSKVPNDRELLESLPGIGRKCANVILSNLYDEPVIAVDTHVSRVSKRLGIAKKNDEPLVIEKKLNKVFPKDKLSRLHHQLVLFGRYKCKAKNPLCDDCNLQEICKEKATRK